MQYLLDKETEVVRLIWRIFELLLQKKYVQIPINIDFDFFLLYAAK